MRSVFIPKSNGKLRRLGIPTMKDRATQALYAMALLPVAEATADPHSYGFRPKRGVADAIAQCHINLSQKNRATWVLEGDIKACFDKIDHQWLLDQIPMDHKVLSQWLKAGYLEKGTLFPTEAGTPQGGIISPILANMALDEIQEMLASTVPKGSKVNFVRYADDFICTGINEEILQRTVKPAIETFLRERGLMRSQEKTKITHIEEGFDFLGYNLKKFGEKMLIKPATGKIKHHRLKLKTICRQLRFRKTFQVIAALNRVQRGWGNFYRNCCASKVFSQINHDLFQMVKRELKRRHSKKSGKWIRRTYFKTIGNDHWILAGKERREDQERTHYLFQLGRLPIRRHVKFLMAAHPFDPTFNKYIRKRKAMNMANRLKESHLKGRTLTKWTRSKNTAGSL
nr:group II intron reverse transcriptase/maturase [Acanthopleuribacter pedis]